MKPVQELLIDAAGCMLNPPPLYALPRGCCRAIGIARIARGVPPIDDRSLRAVRVMRYIFRDDSPYRDHGYWMGPPKRDREFRATALLLAAYAYPEFRELLESGPP